MRVWAFAALVFTLGCPDAPSTELDAGKPGTMDGGTPDSGIPPDSGVLSWTFDGEELPGPSLSLVGREVTDDRLTVDVVGRGLDDVYGVAVRVSYDPAVLRFSSFDQSAAWTHGGLWAVEAPTPGAVVIAASAIGLAAGIPVDGDAIGSLIFERVAEAESFVGLYRGYVLAADGAGRDVATGRGGLVRR